MEEKNFTLYWLDGEKETIKGYDFSDAFRKAGYSNGSLNALDFFSTNDDLEWDYDPTTAAKWIKVSNKKENE